MHIISKKAKKKIVKSNTSKLIKAKAVAENNKFSVYYNRGADFLEVAFWNEKTPVNLQLLEESHDVYKISSNIKDYILVSFDIIGTYSPNANFVTFIPEQLLKFSSVYGMPNWKTFIGKPVFIDHQPANLHPAESIGVILDAKVVKIPNVNCHRIHILKAIDRTKNKKIANKVLSGEINSASMTASPDYLVCSIHGVPSSQCKCNQWGKVIKTREGEKLANLLVVNPLFLESSVLTKDNPADRHALSLTGPFTWK